MIGLNEDVSLISISGRDFYGNKNLNEYIPEKCRVIEKYELVKNKENEEVMSSLQFSFDENSNVSIDMKIKYKEKVYGIISISPKKHFTGEVVYKKVYAE